MNSIDKIIGFFSPEAALRRSFYRHELEELKRHGYDAGDSGRLNANWGALIESAEMTDRTSRDTIRARARDLERNSDMMGGVISAYVRNVIGKGFTLQAKTEDEALNEEIEKLWREWIKAKNCDVTGQQSFNQLLRMAVLRKKVDGGILFKKCYTNDGIIPFQLQAIEVDELSLSWSQPKNPKHKVAGGVEYNEWNRPVGYWLTQYSVDGVEVASPVYYDAKDIIFLFTKRRPSQVREISDMTPTLTRIRDVNEFITAVSVKERIAACLSVFIKKAVPASGLGRNGMAASAAIKNYEGKRLSPGMIAELNAGDEVQIVDPKGTSNDAAAFLKLQQRLIGTGQGLSYEGTSRDMSETNYSSARQSSIEDEMTYAEEIELLVEKFMSPVYEAFVESALLCGAITVKGMKWTDAKKLTVHKWAASPKKWIDPLKEANATRVALESGQKTFTQVCAENGRDWREVIDEMAAAQEYATAKGVNIVQGKAPAPAVPLVAPNGGDKGGTA